MHMKQARVNCRERFTTDDLEFVAAAVQRSELSEDRTEPSTLRALLGEPEALNAALESDKLLKAILETPGNLPVSPQFYFYVLTRHMLMRFDRSVADYVASVLATFVAPRALPNPDASTLQRPTLSVSISDMLIALRS